MDTGQTKIEKTKNNYLIIQFFSVLSRVVLHQIFYSWGHPVEGSTENDKHQKMINMAKSENDQRLNLWLLMKKESDQLQKMINLAKSENDQRLNLWLLIKKEL